MFLATLGTLRHTLHAYPERAGGELMTSSLLADFLAAYGPDQLLTQLGGHGLAAVFDGPKPGPTVMLRADLDAVPVEGEHGPTRALHLCGHDGHCSMVAGVAALFHYTRPHRGRVVLLFQPAEETGEGAAAIIQEPRFAQIAPDVALGLHNLPGYPFGQVVMRTGTFASASVGMKVELIGAESHAAEPHKGRSPGHALSHLIPTLPELAKQSSEPRLATITHLDMGARSFGVSPGRAELFVTLRALTQRGLTDLREQAERLVRARAADDDLDVNIRWVDDFPETWNDEQAVSLVEQSCSEEGIDCAFVERPFPWSDDFGHFGQLCPSVYFGLGIGEEAPRLHQLDYRFPDAVMEHGVRVLHRAAITALGSDEEEPLVPPPDLGRVA